MKNYQQQVLEVIQKAVEQAGSQNKLALAIGTDRAKICKWLGGTSPNTKDFAALAAYVGAQIVLPDQSVRDFKQLLQVEHNDFSGWQLAKAQGQTVPETVLDFLLAHKHRDSDICFSTDLLEFLGVDGAKALLYIYPNTDPSMRPTLQGGDQLLVDTRRKEIEDTQLYLIEDDGFKVRRLTRSFGTVIMSADSPSFSNLPLQKAENGTYPIVGQVVWIGKSLV